MNPATGKERGCVVADETKTKQQLIAELGAPRTDREPSSSGSDKPAPAEKRGPALLEPKTRRGLLSWAAPVLLSLGTVLKPGTAHAASTDDFVPPPPARKGRCVPTPHASSTPDPSESSAAPPTALASAETAPGPEATSSAADPAISAQRGEVDAPDVVDDSDKRL